MSLAISIANAFLVSAMAYMAYRGMERGAPFWPFFLHWYGPAWVVQLFVGTWLAASFDNPFAYLLAVLGALGSGIWLVALGRRLDRLRRVRVEPRD